MNEQKKKGCKDEDRSLFKAFHGMIHFATYWNDHLTYMGESIANKGHQ